MDPLALAAVVGLVFAGKTLAEGKEKSAPSPVKPTTTKPPLNRRDIDMMADSVGHRADAFDLRNTNPNFGRRINDWRLQPKDAVPNLQDVTPTNSRFPYGQPVYDLYNREYITNKQNNLSPLEQPMRIGPGLGVGPDVLAAGGFHDYFRALPTNINEERLTTLEGREGPSNPSETLRNKRQRPRRLSAPQEPMAEVALRAPLSHPRVARTSSRRRSQQFAERRACARTRSQMDLRSTTWRSRMPRARRATLTPT